MPTLPDFDDDRFVAAPLWSGAARVTGFAFRTGQTIPEHAVAKEAFLLVTEGQLAVHLGDQEHSLSAGEGLVLPATVPHSVRAATDARMVLIRAR